jgi:hypothetical protein
MGMACSAGLLLRPTLCITVVLWPGERCVVSRHLPCSEGIGKNVGGQDSPCLPHSGRPEDAGESQDTLAMINKAVSVLRHSRGPGNRLRPREEQRKKESWAERRHAAHKTKQVEKFNDTPHRSILACTDLVAKYLGLRRNETKTSSSTKAPAQPISYYKPLRQLQPVSIRSNTDRRDCLWPVSMSVPELCSVVVVQCLKIEDACQYQASYPR